MRFEDGKNLPGSMFLLSLPFVKAVQRLDELYLVRMESISSDWSRLGDWNSSRINGNDAYSIF